MPTTLTDNHVHALAVDLLHDYREVFGDPAPTPEHELIDAAIDYAQACLADGTDPEDGLHRLHTLDADELDAIASGTVEKAWRSDDHPRDKVGRFISKDDLQDAKHDPEKADELRERVHPEDAKKLEDVLSGKTDVGRTKRGEAKHQARQKRERVKADRDEGRAIRDRLFKQYQAGEPLHPDDLRALIPHLSTMTHAELSGVRVFLGGAGAKFGGARGLDERRQRLVEWARGGTEAMPEAAPAKEEPPTPATPADAKSLATQLKDWHAKNASTYNQYNAASAKGQKRLAPKLAKLDAELNDLKARHDAAHEALAQANGHQYGVYHAESPGAEPKLVHTANTLAEAVSHSTRHAEAVNRGLPSSQGKNIVNEHGEPAGYPEYQLDSGGKVYVGKVPNPKAASAATKFGQPGDSHALAGVPREQQGNKIGELIGQADSEKNLDPSKLGDTTQPPPGFTPELEHDIRGVIARHAQTISAGAQLDSLYAAVAKKHGLTKHDFQRAIAHMHEKRVIRLSGWPRSTGEIPDPELATFLPNTSKVQYYAHPPQPLVNQPDAGLGDPSLNTSHPAVQAKYGLDSGGKVYVGKVTNPSHNPSTPVDKPTSVSNNTPIPLASGGTSGGKTMTATEPHPASTPVEMPHVTGTGFIDATVREQTRREAIGKKLASAGALLPHEAIEHATPDGDRRLTASKAEVVLTNRLGLPMDAAKTILAGLKPAGEVTVGGNRKKPAYDVLDLYRATGKLHENPS